MAWTAPRTWVTGEVVTASIMNTHIRDNLLFLESALPLFGTTSLTIPAAGDYWVGIGAAAASLGANSNITLTLTAGGKTLFAAGGGTGGGTQGGYYSIFDTDLLTGLTASQVLTPSVGGNTSPTKQYIFAHRKA